MTDLKEEVPERYRVKYDSFTGSFKILDCWHDVVRNLGPDAEVSDNSPAIKILTSEEINALLGELKKLDWLEKYAEKNASRGVAKTIAPRESIQEVAIRNIKDITLETYPDGANSDVAKEAVLAIREIINKLA